MSYIFIVCLALIVFFSFSLITKPKKAVSEKIFVVWILLMALTELSFFLFSLGLFSRYLLLFSIVCDTHVLHGAFFYLYVCSFINSSFEIRSIHWLHVFPFLLLLGLKLYFNAVLGVMDCYGAGCVHYDNRYVDLLSFLKFFILGAYLFMGWHKVHDLKAHYRGQEKIDQVRLSWIYNVTIGVFLLFTFAAFYKVLTRLDFNFLGNDITAINIMVSFFILVFLYMGNSYTYLFVAPTAGQSILLDGREMLVEKPSNHISMEGEEIENSAEKYQLIEQFLGLKKPYLEGQFTLRELSESVNVPQSEISQIINQYTGKYYCDYMNDFRLEALKEKLNDTQNDKYTIFSLALDCGFASKTSFNRIFKNSTGVTPTEYRKERGE